MPYSSIENDKKIPNPEKRLEYVKKLQNYFKNKKSNYSELSVR